MAEPVFVNGKAYLDHCHQCHESKAVIKKSQQYRQNIYCGAVDYFGELEWEADHHVFVLFEKKYKAEQAAEKKWFEENGEF